MRRAWMVVHNPGYVLDPMSITGTDGGMNQTTKSFHNILREGGCQVKYSSDSPKHGGVVRVSSDLRCKCCA
jgi:hypothetical protein